MWAGRVRQIQEEKERKRDRERATEGEIGRDKDREREIEKKDRQTERQRDKETDREFKFTCSGAFDDQIHLFAVKETVHVDIAPFKYIMVQDGSYHYFIECSFYEQH